MFWVFLPRVGTSFPTFFTYPQWHDINFPREEGKRNRQTWAKVRRLFLWDTEVDGRDISPRTVSVFPLYSFTSALNMSSAGLSRWSRRASGMWAWPLELVRPATRNGSISAGLPYLFIYNRTSTLSSLVTQHLLPKSWKCIISQPQSLDCFLHK